MQNKASNESLSYQALKDLLIQVKQDKPHVLLLMGPFVDNFNASCQSGELFYEVDKETRCADYEELFVEVLRLID